MQPNAIIILTAFVTVSSLIAMIFVALRGRQNRLATRLHELAGKEVDKDDQTLKQMAETMLPKIGTPLMPEMGENRSQLQARLIHAGFYGRQAMAIFLGVKMLLMVILTLLGLTAGLLGLLPVHLGIIFGAALGTFASVGPNHWLDQKKAARQASFRRSLPDALDVIVICLEGGLSLPGALRRVASELKTAHPLLANELNILLREVQLGQTSGESLRHFADRTDMEELRSLASVVLQSERLGAGLSQAMRVHGDTLRFKRLQMAEEKAQKASVLMLFPTIFFIFPGVFIVILGPAVIRIFEMFSKMKL